MQRTRNLKNLVKKLDISALDVKRITPRPGLEPGSKAPQASRISTTLPGHKWLRLPRFVRVHRLNNCLIRTRAAPDKNEFIGYYWIFSPATSIVTSTSTCAPVISSW